MIALWCALMLLPSDVGKLFIPSHLPPSFIVSSQVGAAEKVAMATTLICNELKGLAWHLDAKTLMLWLSRSPDLCHYDTHCGEDTLPHPSSPSDFLFMKLHWISPKRSGNVKHSLITLFLKKSFFLYGRSQEVRWVGEKPLLCHPTLGKFKDRGKPKMWGGNPRKKDYNLEHFLTCSKYMDVT